MSDWSGTHVLILGAARQGLAAARWLARHGARVTLNDQRPAEQLAAARRELSALAVRWVFGGHPLEVLAGIDVLCLSGGIPLENPLVVAAQERGIPLTNDTQIFMEAAPCRTAGITGSAGKTTTTTLLGRMGQKSMEDPGSGKPARRVFVGGNLGDPLLNHVDDMGRDDLAILEISSFQLEQLTISPNVAAILNITPNHLDRHGTMEKYIAAKRRILEFQSASDTAVLCRENPGSWELRSAARGHLMSFGLGALPEGMDGTFLAEGILHLRERGVELPLLDASLLQIRGEHNLLNTLAAFALGHVLGLPLDAMLLAVSEFNGVAHRLEFVAERRGANWYNDSIATAPERTMAAIRSFQEPLILLLGGRDKNLPWEDLARLVRNRARHAILFGEAAPKIKAALEQATGNCSLQTCPDLQQAVQVAANLATPGDVVLLSPGGTSFDQFRDFEERGEAFRKWVSALS